MISVLVAVLSVALSVQSLAGALKFSSAGLGAGGALGGLGAFGLGTTQGDVAAVGSGAEGGTHNGINLGASPTGSLSQESADLPLSSPEAADPLSILPALNLGGLLSRPVYGVPDYRSGYPQPARTQPSTSGTRKRVKRIVKKRYSAGQVEQAAAPPQVCWTLSKRCCYEEVHQGYECKDYYAYKHARCHPVIAYAEKCSAVQEEPREHPKPAGKVRYEESIIKNYDTNYGPHVQGYPEGGESEYYQSEVIPNKPYKVTGEPYPAPTTYVAVDKDTSSSESVYKKTATTIDSYTASGEGTDAESRAQTPAGAGEEYQTPSGTAPPTESPSTGVFTTGGVTLKALPSEEAFPNGENAKQPSWTKPPTYGTPQSLSYTQLPPEKAQQKHNYTQPPRKEASQTPTYTQPPWKEAPQTPASTQLPAQEASQKPVYTQASSKEPSQQPKYSQPPSEEAPVTPKPPTTTQQPYTTAQTTPGTSTWDVKTNSTQGASPPTALGAPAPKSGGSTYGASSAPSSPPVPEQSYRMATMYRYRGAIA